jgi:hypothetical protein
VKVKDEFDELSGRIEGVSRVLLHLIAKLEDSGVVDGPALTELSRRSAQDLRIDRPNLQATQRTMLELCAALDDARKHRQESGHLLGNPKNQSS